VPFFIGKVRPYMADALTLTLEKIKRRDEDAIAELVRTHHRQLRGYVAAISADLGAVDDISQDVFLRALERLDRVADLEDFPRFMRGIARNVVREHARRSARHCERYIEFIDECFSTEEKLQAESPVNDPQVVAAMRQCLTRLPERSRQMLDMRYSEELHAEDIGRTMGLNGGAVRASLLRIREALLKCVRASLSGQAAEAGL
jgi:RNA polymerase sigma-70 factor, ECF subfamily